MTPAKTEALEALDHIATGATGPFKTSADIIRAALSLPDEPDGETVTIPSADLKLLCHKLRLAGSNGEALLFMHRQMLERCEALVGRCDNSPDLPTEPIPAVSPQPVAVEKVVEAIGAWYIREDDAWHFYTMPGVVPMNLTLKGFDGVDYVLGLLRAGLTHPLADGEREALVKERDALLKASAFDKAGDTPDEYSEAIALAHPLKNGDFKTYTMALEMVSNRHSKSSLVNLVGWLLARLATSRALLAEAGEALRPLYLEWETQQQEREPFRLDDDKPFMFYRATYGDLRRAAALHAKMKGV